MYNNSTYNPYNSMINQNNNNIHYTTDERGFLAPFILGGITGGLVAPAFYRPYPYYNNNPYYYRPYYRPYPYYY